MTTLKQSATSGVKWSAISQAGRQITQLATTIVLARLLSPSDFGLMGMATVVIGFVALFKDLGTAAAVIQRKEPSENLLSSIFWINAVFGLAAMAALFTLAPLVADLFQEPRLTPMLQWLSLTFFFSGLSILQQALLERNLAFRTLAKVEIGAVVLGAIVGVGSALAGAGVWSLVYQSLTVVTVTTVLLWMSARWIPRFVLSWAEVRSISSYSLNLTAFNTFNYFSRNADYFLIGRFLGAQALGYYTLAYRILLYPLQSVSAVIGRVTFPLYAQLQDDNPRFRRVYLRIARVIAALTFPMMLGLWVVAGPFVLTLFGAQWSPVIALLIIFIPVSMAQSIITTVGAIYQVKGRTDWMFRWGVGSSLLAVLGFVIGLRWGIIGVAVSYAVVTAMLAYPNFAIPFRLINLRVSELLKAVWDPFRYSIAMMISMVGLRILESWIGITTPAIILVSSTLLGIITYGGLLILRRSPILQDVAEILPFGRFRWLQRRMAVR